MIPSECTHEERSYNAFLRLAKHLYRLAELLDECQAVIDGKQAYESLNGSDDIVSQLREELETLEGIAKNAQDAWNLIEPHISESVGRLRIETPSDCPTWSLWVLDKAWRAWNGCIRQVQIQEDSRAIIEGMISWKPKLGESTISELNQKITKEFRAGGVFSPPPRKPNEDQEKETVISEIVRRLQSRKQGPKATTADKAESEIKDLIQRGIVTETGINTETDKPIRQRELQTLLGKSAKTFNKAPTWKRWQEARRRAMNQKAK